MWRLSVTEGSVVAAVALLLAACSSDPLKDAASPPTVVSSALTTVAEATQSSIDWVRYVEVALEHTEELFYRPDEVDWDEVRAVALATLGEDPTQERAHRAIEAALRVFPYPHTFFLDPEAAQRRRAETLALPPPSGDVLNGRLGYLNLPSTTGAGEVGKHYASTIHDLARSISESSVCGWVIDLRNNEGGSISPMFLGVGPFLGNGIFFTGRGRTGTGEYSYREGRLLRNGEPVDQTPFGIDVPQELSEELAAAGQLYTEAFLLADPTQPIAVLTSFQTASAGEAVVIAFKGRENTRFFGEPTSGLPTGTTGVYLEDGAVLVITSSVLVDRLGTVYDGSIRPDQIVPNFSDSQGDLILEEASTWLLQQGACGEHTSVITPLAAMTSFGIVRIWPSPSPVATISTMA